MADKNSHALYTAGWSYEKIEICTQSNENTSLCFFEWGAYASLGSLGIHTLNITIRSWWCKQHGRERCVHIPIQLAEENKQVIIAFLL